METHVQKWGNSLAIRIPKSYAQDLGLKPEWIVDISLLNGKLIVTPVTKAEYQLADLLAGITDDNLHAEIDSGDEVGNEAW